MHVMYVALPDWYQCALYHILNKHYRVTDTSCYITYGNQSYIVQNIISPPPPPQVICDDIIPFAIAIWN